MHRHQAEMIAGTGLHRKNAWATAVLLGVAGRKPGLKPLIHCSVEEALPVNRVLLAYSLACAALMTGCAAATSPPAGRSAQTSTEPVATQAAKSQSAREQAPSDHGPALALPTPEVVSSALASEGLMLREPWKLTRGTTDWWTSTARRTWPAALSAVGDVPSEISYFIEGNTSTRVSRITLEAEIYNPQMHGTEMKAEFARLVPKLFAKLGVELPAGLTAAVATEKTLHKAMPYGTVTFAREPYQMGYGLSLKINVTD